MLAARRCVFPRRVTARLSRRFPTVFPFWSGMAKGTEPDEAAAVSPDPDRLLAAAREARDDAAPFALAAAGILTGLALVSRHAHWDLLGHRLWWVWLLVAAPYGCLSATLLFGLCDAPDAAGQGVDGGRVHALGDHRSSRRRTRSEHPRVE